MSSGGFDYASLLGKLFLFGERTCAAVLEHNTLSKDLSPADNEKHFAVLDYYRAVRLAEIDGTAQPEAPAVFANLTPEQREDFKYLQELRSAIEEAKTAFDLELAGLPDNIRKIHIANANDILKAYGCYEEDVPMWLRPTFAGTVLVTIGVRVSSAALGPDSVLPLREYPLQLRFLTQSINWLMSPTVNARQLYSYLKDKMLFSVPQVLAYGAGIIFPSFYNNTLAYGLTVSISSVVWYLGHNLPPRAISIKRRWEMKKYGKLVNAQLMDEEADRTAQREKAQALASGYLRVIQSMKNASKTLKLSQAATEQRDRLIVKVGEQVRGLEASAAVAHEGDPHFTDKIVFGVAWVGIMAAFTGGAARNPGLYGTIATLNAFVLEQVYDCVFDNKVSVEQMEQRFSTLGSPILLQFSLYLSQILAGGPRVFDDPVRLYATMGCLIFANIFASHLQPKLITVPAKGVRWAVRKLTAKTRPAREGEAALEVDLMDLGETVADDEVVGPRVTEVEEVDVIQQVATMLLPHSEYGIDELKADLRKAADELRQKMTDAQVAELKEQGYNVDDPGLGLMHPEFTGWALLFGLE